MIDTHVVVLNLKVIQIGIPYLAGFVIETLVKLSRLFGSILFYPLGFDLSPTDQFA